MKYADMAITVSDLNKYMKEKIAEDEYLNNILIKGEISNLCKSNGRRWLRRFIY